MGRGLKTCAVGCILLSGAEALRHRRSAGDMPSVAQVGEPGLVDFTYTFGAPGSASPPLQNTVGSDPCFPGLRVWLTTPGRFGSKWVDFVTFITNTVNYFHARMDAEDLTEDLPEQEGAVACHEGVTNMPSIGKPSTRLHRGDTYIEQMDKQGEPLLANFTFFGRTEHMKNPAQLAIDARAFGWRLVGANYGSHLLQNPDNLECVITFRGTEGTSEWLGNAQLGAVHFCGLTNPEDSCGRAPCTTSKPRGSFTHQGFTNRLRAITQDSEWQQNVRRHLSSCSKVYAVGHSAGGSMAELFTACQASAPQAGEFGYDTDYQYVSWVKGNAQRLPYL